MKIAPLCLDALSRAFFISHPAVLIATGMILNSAQLMAAAPELEVRGNQVVVKSTGSPIRLTGVNCPSLEWGSGEHLKSTDIHGGSISMATTTWKSNIIRLPVDVNRWLAGGTYIATVDDVIAHAANNNAYVILDLHEYGHPTPQCNTFWSQAAARYKNNPTVLFGLLNEPHGTSWSVWRDGDSTNPGMQDLLNTVRATGANNVVLAGGLDYAYDISGAINGYALTDTASGNGIIYDTHIYPWKGSWQTKVGNVAQKYPVLAGEIGHPNGTSFIGLTFEGPTTWVPRVMDWVDTHNLHWTGWSFHPGADPCMISDWNYTPTSWWGTTALSRLQTYQTATTPRVIGGTVIGTTGTRTDPDSGVLTDAIAGAVAPFIGNNTKYFNAATSSGGWTGLDLVRSHRITKIMFVPRMGYGNLMVGGVFQGSNVANFSSGVITLHTVSVAPNASGDVWTTANISNTGAYRYVRYLGPSNAYCNVAAIKILGYPSSTASPPPSAGANLLTNPSFDASGATQTPSGWTEWKDLTTSYTETTGGAHGGSYHGTHRSSASAYEVSTYQIKTGLASGRYTLRAWVKSSGGQSGAQMYVKGYDAAAPSSKLVVSLSTAASTWTQVTIPNITLSSGHAEIAFWSRVSAAGQWIYFDDAEFFKQ